MPDTFWGLFQPKDNSGIKSWSFGFVLEVKNKTCFLAFYEAKIYAKN